MRNPKDLCGGIGVVVFLVFIIILFWRDNILTSFLLLVLSGITLFSWRKRRDLLYFIVPGILGPSLEAVCIYFGAWAYNNPSLIIPIWLPIAWALAGISMGRIADFFIESPGGLK